MDNTTDMGSVFYGRNHKNFGNVLTKLVKNAKHRVWVVSPYVTGKTPSQWVQNANRRVEFRLLTRMSERDFSGGASSVETLKNCIQEGWGVRYLHDAKESLHAKLFVIGDNIFIGSANFTRNGLSSNLELASKLISKSESTHVLHEFEKIWNSSPECSINLLEQIALNVSDGTENLEKNRDTLSSRLIDWGSVQPWFKISGHSGDRMGPDWDCVGEVNLAAGQTFPKNGTPSLREGDPVILARMAKKNNKDDYIIFGHGIVHSRHREKNDKLQQTVISRVPHQQQADFRRWPSIVWLERIEVVNGKAEVAPWLSDIDPDEKKIRRRSLGRKSHIRISGNTFAWLRDALNQSFKRTNGPITPSANEVWWNEYLPRTERMTLESSDLKARR
ncbi:MAG: phospholipase D family protein [Chloroflexi bacterium]|nr:phospholipase D family protein [Chloroflexota bacterium]